MHFLIRQYYITVETKTKSIFRPMYILRYLIKSIAHFSLVGKSLFPMVGANITTALTLAASVSLLIIWQLVCRGHWSCEVKSVSSVLLVPKGENCP